jgi:hypothetical protein
MQEDLGGKSYVYFKNLATGVSGKISNSTHNQAYPDIDGNRAVWMQEDSTGTFIYLRNFASGYVGKITTSTQTQILPAIDGDRVIWMQIDSTGYFTINLRNFATGFNGKITSPTKTMYFIGIDGPRIVWQSSFGVINYKNLVTGVTGKVSTTQQKYDSAISGTRIVWTQYETTGHYVVYTKDIATGKTGRVTS